MHIDTKMTRDYTINIEQPIAQMRKGAKDNRDNAKNHDMETHTAYM